jgi:hypothetical protein
LVLPFQRRTDEGVVSDLSGAVLEQLLRPELVADVFQNGRVINGAWHIVGLAVCNLAYNPAQNLARTCFW